MRSAHHFLSLFLLLTLAGAVSAPSQGPIQRRTRPAPRAAKAPLLYYDGFLISMEAHQVEIETISQRRVICRLTAQTEYTTSPAEFAPGDRIGVSTASAREDDCVAAWLGRPDERFEKRRARPIFDRRNRSGGLEADDPPLVRTDPLILKAVEANNTFSANLPDYTCHQVTTRSDSRNLGKKWTDKNVVEADVLLYKGKEEYQNITIDGAPTTAKMNQTGSAWSTGEFGAILHNLFLDPTRADFKPSGEPELIRGRRGIPYSFTVEQERSMWNLDINNQSYSPAYTGRVWLDEESGRALRIEMEALNLPWEYPLITAEAMIEYDEARIGGKTYLLPAEAMNMGCLRGSARCIRNRLEFRDYRKFTADSTMFQTDSTIDFGEKEAPEEKQ